MLSSEGKYFRFDEALQECDFITSNCFMWLHMPSRISVEDLFGGGHFPRLSAAQKLPSFLLIVYKTVL